MSENYKGRYVQISNFRNIGVSEKPQNICINRSVNDDYIGNLVLLIGPNNSGKTNVLNALNILNNDVAFKSTDIPNTICNPKEGTYLKLFEDIDSINVLLIKSFNQNESLSKVTLKQWKENLKNRINEFLTNQMENCGYKNLDDFCKSKNIQVRWCNRKYARITDFYNAVNSWKVDQLIKNWSWKVNSGQLILTKKDSLNSNKVVITENILNEKLINELNEVINHNHSKLSSSPTTKSNITYHFLKYDDGKINKSFFKVKYDEEWNSFFINLFNKLKITQSEIRVESRVDN